MIISKMKKDIMGDARRQSDVKGVGRLLAGGQISMCAFHLNERITNFCTNRECLLPLCPKCVKIHTEEHIKMGSCQLKKAFLANSTRLRTR